MRPVAGKRLRDLQGRTATAGRIDRQAILARRGAQCACRRWRHLGRVRAGGWSCCQAVAWTHIPQRPVKTSKYEVAHFPGSAKAHLVLGWMHVDVHLGGGQAQVEDENRLAAVEQHVPIGLANRLAHHLVLHRTAVNEEELLICQTPGEGRQSHPTGEREFVPLLVNHQIATHEILTQHRLEALFRRTRRH